jgi:hypothetical protein
MKLLSIYFATLFLSIAIIQGMQEQCPPGAYNATTKQCCPEGTTYNEGGKVCCPPGAYNPLTKQCCPTGTRYIGSLGFPYYCL